MRPISKQTKRKIPVQAPINSDIEDIKRKLKELFNFYSSFGDRLNVSNLKSSKFHKMM